MPSRLSSKRPRPVDSDNEHEDEEEGGLMSWPVGKVSLAAFRCSIHQADFVALQKQCLLPLRISPSSSPRRFSTPKPPAVGPYTIPPTLTPVESSDEEAEEDERVAILNVFNISQPSSASSFTSTRANASESDPMDMTEMPPPSTGGWKKPHLTRRRSNGISSLTSPMHMNFSPNVDQPDANGGRIPTPIYGHFTSTDVNMDTAEAALNSFIHPAARLQLRHTHNVLSPMISEDGESEAEWWKRRRLPSPAESPIMSSQRMDTDDLTSPGMMDALSFDNIRTHNSEMDQDHTPSPPLSSTFRGSKGHAMFDRRSDDTSSDVPRKGKLVMGFRADCEKCQKRVPGHYSHIVWG